MLVYVFDTCLRLLHPFMPYITEVLWQQLPHQGKGACCVCVFDIIGLVVWVAVMQ